MMNQKTLIELFKQTKPIQDHYYSEDAYINRDIQWRYMLELTASLLQDQYKEGFSKKEFFDKVNVTP